MAHPTVTTAETVSAPTDARAAAEAPLGPVPASARIVRPSVVSDPPTGRTPKRAAGPKAPVEPEAVPPQTADATPASVQPPARAGRVVRKRRAVSPAVEQPEAMPRGTSLATSPPAERRRFSSEPTLGETARQIPSKRLIKHAAVALVEHVPVWGSIARAAKEAGQEATEHARMHRVDAAIDTLQERVEAGERRRRTQTFDQARALSVLGGKSASNRAAALVMRDAGASRDPELDIQRKLNLEMAQRLTLLEREVNLLRKNVGLQVATSEALHLRDHVRVRSDPMWYAEADPRLQPFRSALEVFRGKPETATPMSWRSSRAAVVAFRDVVDACEHVAGRTLVKRSDAPVEIGPLEGRRKIEFVDHYMDTISMAGSRVNERLMHPEVKATENAGWILEAMCFSYPFLRPVREGGSEDASSRRSSRGSARNRTT